MVGESTHPAASAPKEFRWYVVRVASNREERVRDNLLARVKAAGTHERIRTVLVPTEKFTEIKGGKRREGQRKIFPGYILVEMLLDEESWYLVRGTSGIGDFIGSDNLPMPMEPHEAEKLVGGLKSAEEKPKLDIQFGIGDKVKIKEGPFENFSGVVAEVHPQKGLVRVNVMIFGRETPVELEYWQVEAV
ncbi:MAG: transcription termination/antitermination factor NusG [Planctomycetes bacterium]|nr:transcription termination/antitermination factor NusG [Planctomycetota bacterium]